jgi:putative phosphoesterase
MIKLGVISDTHGELIATTEAVRLFRERGVSVIVHCGDIGGEAVVEAFRGIETHFVYGNTDGEAEFLRDAARRTGNRLHGWFGSLELDGKQIFFLHGHQNVRFDDETESGKWDLICYGHTHIPSLQMFRETILLNPGAFKRVATPTVAIVSLPEMDVERCEV